MNKEDIIDEMCQCGHLKSEHNTTIVFAPGHGSCKNCECKQFTWKKIIYGKD